MRKLNIEALEDLIGSLNAAESGVAYCKPESLRILLDEHHELATRVAVFELRFGGQRGRLSAIPDEEHPEDV